MHLFYRSLKDYNFLKHMVGRILIFKLLMTYQEILHGLRNIFGCFLKDDTIILFLKIVKYCS